MANIKDVAREAGVSVATVSRVFSGRDYVSEKIREQVLTAAQRVSYRPNAVARSLRMTATRTLGLVVPNVKNSFFTTVARAVEDGARERGYSLVVGNSDENPEKEELYLRVLLEKRVDGLIVSPARVHSPGLEAVVGEGVPVVFLDRSAEDVEAPVARADGRDAVARLVDHLVELGHEKLAVISGPPEVVPGRERLEAFARAAEAVGAPLAERYIKIGDFRRPSGAKAMGELLELEYPPTAVFAANNLMALGALQTIRSAKLRIPEDLSLASFDDVSWFPLLDPPLTAIAQPTDELGAASARMLLEMVEGNSRPESMVLEAELRLRGSCGAPEVAKS